ncbi:MAG: endonuclease/exonuclease/phosphatase family protein [Deltaproteobacteria bacterium]|nr:endonuclease/exonuclease/phosphatase family protein [Deltaproteobacteria bacterium]
MLARRLIRLARAHWNHASVSARRRVAGGGLLAFAVAAALALATPLDECSIGGGTRIASFNIEHFPKNDRQVAGAFAAIAELQAPVVGVQEITDPARFAREARARLGDSWRFVAARNGNDHKVGVLFDSARMTLLSAREHTGTIVVKGAKPVLEARLVAREEQQAAEDDPSRVVRLFVVHLKSGADNHGVRARQLRALTIILAASRDSGERIVVVGDFNATQDEDRRAISELAERTELVWASEGLGCTCYWARRDGCLASALDHVLTSVPADVEARGPCETEGCDPQGRCPVFHSEVSDHCPLTADVLGTGSR